MLHTWAICAHVCSAMSATHERSAHRSCAPHFVFEGAPLMWSLIYIYMYELTQEWCVLMYVMAHVWSSSLMSDVNNTAHTSPISYSTLRSSHITHMVMSSTWAVFMCVFHEPHIWNRWAPHMSYSCVFITHERSRVFVSYSCVFITRERSMSSSHMGAHVCSSHMSALWATKALMCDEHTWVALYELLCDTHVCSSHVMCDTHVCSSHVSITHERLRPPILGCIVWSHMSALWATHVCSSHMSAHVCSWHMSATHERHTSCICDGSYVELIALCMIIAHMCAMSST